MEKKKPNKKTGTEGRGCFYRHKYEMMSKSYIREKSSMHLQHYAEIKDKKYLLKTIQGNIAFF